jgi:Recombinase
VERLVYSREQAAQALGVSLATLDRRVVPAIATVKTEWGARLIPAGELERYLAERTEGPRMPRRQPSASGRRSMLPDEVVARIRREREQGCSLAEIADRLNREGIPTGQGGRQWWPSTVRAVLALVRPLLARSFAVTSGLRRSRRSRWTFCY